MRRVLVLALSVLLVMTACSPADEAGDESTTSSTGTETTQPAPQATTTTEAAAVATTTEAPEATTTTEAQSAGGEECLVGTWVLDSDAFVENFASIFASQGMPEAEVDALDGSFTVEMNADGSYTGVRDQWGFSIMSDEGNIVIEINGEETGTWSADGSTLNITQDDSNLTVDATVEVDGEVFPMPESPVDVPPGIATDSSYTCSGDVLTVTNEGVESVLNRS